MNLMNMMKISEIQREIIYSKNDALKDKNFSLSMQHAVHDKPKTCITSRENTHIFTEFNNSRASTPSNSRGIRFSKGNSQKRVFSEENRTNKDEIIKKYEEIMQKYNSTKQMKNTKKTLVVGYQASKIVNSLFIFLIFFA